MIIFTIQGHLEVENKMVAVDHLEFSTFVKIASESGVIPHFRLIWIH